ncbi:MAG: phage capsid protein [Candidatus Thioglobus sp.]|nr:phage capsid protein [Candidatus Thioglobus sp.]
MSTQITTAFVEQYKSNVLHLAQQKGSRLRDTVKYTPVTGKSHFYEAIGAVAASVRTTRHSDTPQVNTPHSRRKVSLVDYDWADLIDQEDKVKMLISPTSEYAMAGANAMGRAMDDAIIAAASGAAAGGVAGATSIALPTSQKIAGGTTGLTLDKLLSAKEIIDSSDADPSESRFLVCSAKQITDLLGTTQVTSSDYNSVRALASGQIDTFLGFKFIRSERLAVASSIRSCLAYTESALGLAVGADITTRISERDDKNYATQVFLSMVIGATRIEDDKLVEIGAKE